MVFASLFFGGSPHINSVNREMPVTNFVIHKDFFKYVLVYFMTLCHGWPCTTYLQHSNWWWWLYCYVLFSSHWFDNWALNCHLPVVNLPRLNFEQSSMIHYSEDHHSLFFYLALWRLVFWLMISSRLLILRSKVFST